MKSREEVKFTAPSGEEQVYSPSNKQHINRHIFTVQTSHASMIKVPLQFIFDGTSNLTQGTITWNKLTNILSYLRLVPTYTSIENGMFLYDVNSYSASSIEVKYIKGRGDSFSGFLSGNLVLSVSSVNVQIIYLPGLML